MSYTRGTDEMVEICAVTEQTIGSRSNLRDASAEERKALYKLAMEMEHPVVHMFVNDLCGPSTAVLALARQYTRLFNLAMKRAENDAFPPIILNDPQGVVLALLDRIDALEEQVKELRTDD